MSCALKGITPDPVCCKIGYAEYEIAHETFMPECSPMNPNYRNSPYPIDPVFLERWSPRAFTAEPMPLDTLLTMLEAARWAASSFNHQPWRFVYALRETEHWEKCLNLLIPFNREWTQHASALVFALSRTTVRSPRTGEEGPAPTHSFDTGAACAHMALQALKLGWHVHGIAGVDHERARTDLNIPENVVLEAAFAIGRLGDALQLPETLRSREFPSSRLPLTELIFEGKM